MRLWTVSGEPGQVPLDRFDVPESLRAIWLARCGAPDGSQPGRDPPLRHCGAPGPHVLTGPVAVDGARAGDVLKVEVLDAEVAASWGWNAIRRGKGALANHPGFEDHPGETLVVPIDLDAGTYDPPWIPPVNGGGPGSGEGEGEGDPGEGEGEGSEDPGEGEGEGSFEKKKKKKKTPTSITRTAFTLREPFFGQMGVAPDPALGEQSSVLPGDYGGNLDNKMLGPGATVYFRVNIPGALFSAGDGHAAQGDGEFCVTALEACMVGRFRLTVVKADDDSVTRAEEDAAVDDDSDSSSPPGRVVDASAANGLSSPRATTATHYVTMAFAESLDAAETAALVDMLEWMAELTGADRTSLYRTASLVADMRVTQVVNGRKGVHLTMPKSVAHETRARTRRARRAEGRRGGGEGEENRAKARRDGGGEKEEL